MSTRRDFILQSAALAGFGASALPAHAQGLQLAKIICGFPPGGTSDAMSRRLADKLRGNYAASVVVENKPGAGGQIGVTTLRDSAPDGSTMLLTPSSMLPIYPFTFPKLSYKVDEVQPVSLAMYTQHVFSVGPLVPDSVKDLKSFLAWAKANPDKATYGSPGAGSMPHLIGVLVTKASGVELRHAPYRGSAPGIQDLLGGQIAAFFGPSGDVIAHSKAGKVRVLGTSGGERNVFLPDVPTLREQGVQVALREWYAIFMPAKVSADVVERASAMLRTAIGDREVVEFAKQFGLEAQASGPRDLAELLKRDTGEWGGLVKQTGFTAES